MVEDIGSGSYRAFLLLGEKHGLSDAIKLARGVNMGDRVGQQLGNYRLIHLIGRGTFAEVYLGEHLHLNTQVAVKVLLPHERGVIHGDVKPESLVFGRNDEILLTDFSLAFLAKGLPSQQTQEMVGTTAYTAPEQIQGHPCPTSDQYTLGIVAYEWLSGKFPFSGSFAEIASPRSAQRDDQEQLSRKICLLKEEESLDCSQRRQI